MSIESLESVVYWANWAVIVALALSFVAGGASIIASRRLSVAKDEQMRLQLAKMQADAEAQLRLETTKVRSDAAKEEKRIETEAQERIATVEANAREKIAEITAEAEQARRDIANAHVEAARANESAAKANERAEEERVKRLELEKSLARRSIPFIGDPTRSSNLDPLKPFAGVQVIIEYLPDVEASRAASNLAFLLQMAGWRIVKQAANAELNEGFWDGVVVQAHDPRNPKDMNMNQLKAEMDEYMRMVEAANSLVKFLRSNNWAARRHATFHEDVPSNTIRISVGMKPAPEVLTKERAEFLKRFGEDPDRPIPQERTQPRHLTAEQRKAIIERLKELSRQEIPPVELTCPEGNKEACVFADEIASVLMSVGWPLKNNGAIRDKDFPRRQVGIVISRGSRFFIQAAYLFTGLEKLKIEAKLEYEESPSSDPLHILVGW